MVRWCFTQTKSRCITSPAIARQGRLEPVRVNTLARLSVALFGGTFLQPAALFFSTLRWDYV
jgi:hypothetical protein